MSLLLAVTGAHAEPLTVRGRGTGSSLSLLGGDVTLARTADTGEQQAEAPGSFSKSGEPPATLSVPPVVEILSSSSRTEGVADASSEGNRSFVATTAGDVVARVLPGQASGGDLLGVATSGAELVLACDDSLFPGKTEDGVFATSSLRVLDLAGDPLISNPGTVPPNTVLVLPGFLDLLILNEQTASSDPATGSFSMTVNALALRILESGELLELVFSSASGGIRNVPSGTDCALFPPPPLFNSLKKAELAVDADSNGKADVGDTLRFVIEISNSSTAPVENVRVVDRLPSELDLVGNSAKLDGSPIAAEVGPCPGEVTFERCSSEPSDSCLVVAEVGPVAPGQTRRLTFEMTVTDRAISQNGKGSSCNTVRINDVERDVTVPIGSGFDVPPVRPDPLKTTGSGGCSVVRPGERTPADLGPVALLLGLLALRCQRRPRRS